MNDKSPVKIICRIINLTLYVTTVCLIYLTSLLLINTGIEQVTIFFENKTKAIMICAIPLLIIMIISLILKYTLEEGNRVNPYRIIDTITRIISTIPITLVSCYYIFSAMKADDIIHTIIGIVLFFIIDKIIILTLQETLSVTFIIHDNL